MQIHPVILELARLLLAVRQTLAQARGLERLDWSTMSDEAFGDVDEHTVQNILTRGVEWTLAAAETELMAALDTAEGKYALQVLTGGQ